MTLFQCDYTWPDAIKRTPQEASTALRSVFAVAEAIDHSALIKGWYQYPGSQNGFLLVDVESAEVLDAFLRPYLELMSFQSQPLLSHDYADLRGQVLAAKL